MMENPEVQSAEINPQIELPSNNSEKKQKPLLVAGLVVLLAISLGAAGFFAYQNYLLKNEKELEKNLVGPSPVITQATLPEATEVSSSVPTPDPFVDWLTHTHDCYSFKYPNEVILTERKEENLIHLSLWGPTQKQNTEFYDGISLTFSFPLNLEGVSLGDYVDAQVAEDQQHSDIIKPKEAITINNIAGYTYINEGLGTFQNIFLQSLSKVCAVRIVDASRDPGNQGYEQTVDKILSSFQFLK